MSFIINIIKGAIIGISNVVPGFSGGTMALSLGIYDKMISAISNLFRQFKKSISLLIPILIGCVIGIVAFSYAIEYLLANQPLPTCLTLVGLILGGIPMLAKQLSSGIKKSQKGHVTFVNLAMFIIFFALAIILPFISGSDSASNTITLTWTNVLIVFVMGMIAAATMVIPGVSGSMILMILGYYYGIINSITGFVDGIRSGDLSAVLSETAILVPFGIGILAGIFLIAKLIDYLFKRHPASTYMAILGLVISSPFAIFYNTNALAAFSAAGLAVGIVLMLAGALLTWCMSRTKR